jgi:LacI family transcriptional regulator
MSNRLLRTPTLKDIAAQAEVSVPTVSRVLAGDARARVSAQVRGRILAAAKELNYRPNVLARGLKSRRTETLALMLPVLDNPVFPEIVQGAEEAALEEGYSLFISRLGPDMINRRQYLTILQEGRFDGLILVTALIEDRDRKSTRLNSSHRLTSRMPSSA